MTDKDQILKSFGKSSLKVAELLKGTERLTPDERNYIENHVLIVQMAITSSKYSVAQKSPRST